MKLKIVGFVLGAGSFILGYLMGRRDGRREFIGHTVEMVFHKMWETGEQDEIHNIPRTEDKKEPSENRD